MRALKNLTVTNYKRELSKSVHLYPELDSRIELDIFSHPIILDNSSKIENYGNIAIIIEVIQLRFIIQRIENKERLT